MGERNAALARLVKAGDAIEHGGFAGAVRPDQRRDVAVVRREREIVHGGEAAEPHGQVLDLEQRRAHPCPSLTRVPEMALRSARCTEACRVEIKPRARTSMISPIANPNSSLRYMGGSEAIPKS